MPPTLEEIRRRGLAPLCRELGRAGMIRLLQQFEASHSDYARARRGWVDRTSLDDLRELAAPAGTGKRRRSTTR
jgi:hypothetical protein